MNPAAKEPALVIRSPEPRDHARMAALAGQLGYQSSCDDIARRLAAMRRSADQAVFVAETREGEVAGWIGAFVYRCVEVESRVEISGLVVDERLRSTGIGRRLLERVEEWAGEKGCARVNVRCNVVRERAHEFYARSGYEHHKTQKSFRKRLI
jgi:GNAT superfamily N-acetyltransferase